MRILVGVDGSTCSIHAATQAGRLASKLRAELELIYVVPPPLFPSGEGTCELDLEGATGNFARKMLTGVRRGLQDRCPVTKLRVLQGSAAEVLVDQARAQDVILVVVGSRGHGALARALLGSHSDRVVRHSPKPVLVVK